MELNHLFTEEDRMFRDMLRKFVDKEIMPIREQLEEDYSLVEEVHQKIVDHGFIRGGFMTEYGGTEAYGSTITQAILLEELTRGDAGIAVSAGTTSGAMGLAAFAENKAVLDRFSPEFCGDKVNHFCWAMTDSTGGCDTENPVLHGKGITTRAKLDGDEYVINGSKSWPTNASVASVYLVICSTDPDAGEEGIAQIYVPGDTPGISFGKREAKVGYKTCVNTSIFFEDVRVPKEYRLAGPGMDAKLFHADSMCFGQWMNAIQCLGIAQPAFEIALEYTRERKSGGKSIREWSLVAGIISDMAMRLDMMRAGVYNLAVMLDNHEHYGPPYSNKIVSKASALRIFCAEACEFIVSRSIELLGSNGLSPEYHLEKYFRDAAITRTVLGGQQMPKYGVVRGYYDYELR